MDQVLLFKYFALIKLYIFITLQDVKPARKNSIERQA